MCLTERRDADERDVQLVKRAFHEYSCDVFIKAAALLGKPYRTE